MSIETGIEHEWEEMEFPEFLVPQKITIELDEYEQLLADSRFLNALKAAGVDNWNGYSDAYNLMDEE